MFRQKPLSLVTTAVLTSQRVCSSSFRGQIPPTVVIARTPWWMSHFQPADTLLRLVWAVVLDPYQPWLFLRRTRGRDGSRPGAKLSADRGPADGGNPGRPAGPPRRRPAPDPDKNV